MSDSSDNQEATRDFAGFIDAVADGWKTAMGVRIVRATVDEVVAELEIGPQHLQPLGIVHGGVHSGLIETVASIGASISTMSRGRYAVGLENHTTFVKAVRSGKLRATARPVTRGGRSHVWEVDVVDDEGALAATGRVRLLVLEGNAKLAGETVGTKG